jgi:4-amino-4-deoxy-L-arabinose transferase-like glycosyltransferase
MKTKIKDSWVVAGLFLLSLAIGVVSTQVEPVIWWDEGVYSGMGHWLAAHPTDYRIPVELFEDFTLDRPDLAGYRAPLLPYLLAAAYRLLVPVILVVPVVTAGGVAALYLFIRRAVDRRTGVLAALFMAGLPLFAYFQGKMLTDSLAAAMGAFVLLAFWRGFEEGDRRFKFATGALAGLAVLARATYIWLPLALGVYLLVRHRSLNFLRDRWLWAGIGALLVVLAPWFWYGVQAYGNPLGPVLHSMRAVYYWGGLQPASFYLQNWLWAFSVIGLLAIVGAVLAARSRQPAALLLLIWVVAALAFGANLPHKEMRYLLPAAPALAGLAALAVGALPRWSLQVVLVALLITALCTAGQLNTTFANVHNGANDCFLGAMTYLSGVEKDAVIFNKASPVVYYYTLRPSLPVRDTVTEMQGAGPRYYLWSEMTGGIEYAGLRERAELVWECSSARVWRLNSL